MENTQGPPLNKKDPSSNITGHQWGGPFVGGYAVCAWCGCIENTKESAVRCREAYMASCGSGPVEWYRRSKWLPPDGKDGK
jgi:hypothetical protein